MKNIKSDMPDDFWSKLHVLQVSHFMQCMDLTCAFNGEEVSDVTRKNRRELFSNYLCHFPEASFLSFCNYMNDWSNDESVGSSNGVDE